MPHRPLHRDHDTADDPAVYLPLKLTYGLIPLLAGLDKFFNVLADWERYLSPAIAELLPVDATTFMMVVGVIEIAAGILVLSRFTRLGAYIVSAWLVLIAIQLVTAGILDIAVRDLAMAVGAYTLGRLAEARVHRTAGVGDLATAHAHGSRS
jgi:uncharacterized membrane protein YphA (DoxX/SURF4 family)